VITHEPDASTLAAATPGRRLTLLTDQVIVRATTEDNDGAYALLEFTTPPGGGFPPHAHRYDDLTLVVLDGVYEVLVGERKTLLMGGDSVRVPRGTIYGFVNPGCKPSRLLAIVTPGAIHAQFLAEVGDRAGRPPWEADMARILAVAPKYGIEFLYPDQDDGSSTPAPR
jgi:quercetin dioxygenase-like cupin family protein